MRATRMNERKKNVQLFVKRSRSVFWKFGDA